MGAHPDRALPAAFLLALFAAGCGPSLAGFSLVKLRAEYRSLPGDVEALKHEAELSFVDGGPVEAINRSLRAGCKASVLAPKDGEARFLTCRACFWLMEYGETPVCYDERHSRLEAQRCSDHCRAAVRRERDNPLWVYTFGAAMGLELKNAFIHTKILNISSLIDILERSVKLDPHVDQGGPLRVLGALYLRAPPWPRGPGDSEKALELIEKAVHEHPEHPLNHFFHAEALADDEEYEEAAEALERARSRVDPVAQGWRAARYLEMIDQLALRIRTLNP